LTELGLEHPKPLTRTLSVTNVMRFLTCFLHELPDSFQVRQSDAYRLLQRCKIVFYSAIEMQFRTHNYRQFIIALLYVRYVQLAAESEL
jgi:hypothetical protein